MLPDGNQIAESVNEVKKIICPLGIEVEKIQACKNSCVLFREDYADLDKCPKCGYDRYKRKRMVEMIIMLMTRMSPTRSEARRRRLTEGRL
jgi:Zn ribbon nucleic-acid-binding protein